MAAKKTTRAARAKTGRQKKRSSRDAGISRIDQPEKRTFGFFVRLMRQGHIYSSFFADRSHGGRRQALAAARAHYEKLVRRLGPVVRRRR